MKDYIFLAVGFIMAYSGYNVAKSKGRGPKRWAVIGFLFGLLGLVVLLVLPKIENENLST